MKSDFLLAVTQLATERRLPREVVINAIEAALVSAFKKDVIGSQNISVKILPTTGDIVVTIHKIVVDSVEEEKDEISLKDARAIRANAELGETVDILEETPQEAGRIAAQTAKQVVMQRLREAERDVVYEEYSTRLNELISGVVQKVEANQVIVNLGRTEAILPTAELVPSEHYRPGQRLRILVQAVERGIKGPSIIVSRAHADLIRRLFELEVPEIVNGAVVIHGIAREPGYRTKVAVEARQEGVDPVGSCVGLRGVRIQNIVNELHGEKIDVIPWNKDPTVFIAQALSPSQVTRVDILGDRNALVVVPDGQLSLAIGREGQNARLAAKLTGWRIDIRSNSEALAEEGERTARGPEQAAADIDEEQATATVAIAEQDAAAVAEPVAAVASPPQQEEAPPTPSEPEVARPAAEAEQVTASTETQVEASEEKEPEAVAAAEQPSDLGEEDIEAALKALEEEEAAQLAQAKEEEEEEEQESFDFDQFLQNYQTTNPDANQGIRFAEDIFPDRGGRFRDREGRGGRRGGGGSR